MLPVLESHGRKFCSPDAGVQQYSCSKVCSSYIVEAIYEYNLLRKSSVTRLEPATLVLRIAHCHHRQYLPLSSIDPAKPTRRRNGVLKVCITLSAMWWDFKVEEMRRLKFRSIKSRKEELDRTAGTVGIQVQFGITWTSSCWPTWT